MRSENLRKIFKHNVLNKAFVAQLKRCQLHYSTQNSLVSTLFKYNLKYKHQHKIKFNILIKKVQKALVYYIQK